MINKDNALIKALLTLHCIWLNQRNSKPLWNRYYAIHKYLQNNIWCNDAAKTSTNKVTICILQSLSSLCFFWTKWSAGLTFLKTMQ